MRVCSGECVVYLLECILPVQCSVVQWSGVPAQGSGVPEVQPRLLSLHTHTHLQGGGPLKQGSGAGGKETMEEHDSRISRVLYEEAVRTSMEKLCMVATLMLVGWKVMEPVNLMTGEALGAGSWER